MSSLRRRLLASPQNDIYYTKFTLKFVEGNANNILYLNSTQYYGIGFKTQIGDTPVLGSNFLSSDVREEVIITENQSGAIIASYNALLPKETDVTLGRSYAIYNTSATTKLRTGLYTVEVWFKAKGKLTLNENSNAMNRKDIVYITDYKAKSSTDKNATEHTTTCLYSIEIEKPKGAQMQYGGIQVGKKGIVNNMTYFVEGE